MKRSAAAVIQSTSRNTCEAHPCVKCIICGGSSPCLIRFGLSVTCDSDYWAHCRYIRIKDIVERPTIDFPIRKSTAKEQEKYDTEYVYERDKGKPKPPNEVLEHMLKSMLKQALGVDYTKISRCHWISSPQQESSSEQRASEIAHPMQNHLGEHLVVELSDNTTAEEMDDTCDAMGLDLYKSILITSTQNSSSIKQSDEPLYRGAVKAFMEDLLDFYTHHLHEDNIQIEQRYENSFMRRNEEPIEETVKHAELVKGINRCPIFIAKLSTAACIRMNEVWDSDMNDREGYIPAAVVLFKASTTRHRFSERNQHGTDPTKNIYRYFRGLSLLSMFVSLCCRFLWLIAVHCAQVFGSGR